MARQMGAKATGEETRIEEDSGGEKNTPIGTEIERRNESRENRKRKREREDESYNAETTSVRRRTPVLDNSRTGRVPDSEGILPIDFAPEDRGSSSAVGVSFRHR